MKIRIFFWKHNIWLHCLQSQCNQSLGIFFLKMWTEMWNKGRNSKSIDFNFFRKLLIYLIYKHIFCLQYFFLFLKRTVRLLFANILEPEPPPYVPPYNQKPMKDINYILDKRCTFYYCFSTYSHNKWGFMTLIERLLVYLIHQ